MIGQHRFFTVSEVVNGPGVNNLYMRFPFISFLLTYTKSKTLLLLTSNINDEYCDLIKVMKILNKN